MSVRDNLIAARALIDTPEKWATDDGKRKANGGRCLCALDAVSEIVGDDTWEGTENERDALTSVLPPSFKKDPLSHICLVAQFNDHPDTAHADIMALYDRAIEAAGDK